VLAVDSAYLFGDGWAADAADAAGKMWVHGMKTKGDGDTT
jgi:hypothetical protein